MLKENFKSNDCTIDEIRKEYQLKFSKQEQQFKQELQN